MFEGWSDRKRITLAKATTEKVLDHLINLLFSHENNAPETESIPRADWLSVTALLGAPLTRRTRG
jgi:hypothetical protein